MFFSSATQSSPVHTAIFCIVSLFVLDASANCNNDKCLKALHSDLAQASSFCSTYATNMAISTPSAINSGCKSSSSKILSACSCINAATTASKTSSTSFTTAKSSSSSRTTGVSTSTPTSRSTSASNPAILASTVTVTVVQSIILPATAMATTIPASGTCIAIPCILYESAIPSCVLSFIQQDFGIFQPNCFGAGFGPNFVKSCVCPFLSQLPAAFQSAGVCAVADITTGLAYQRSECQCLGAVIG